MKPLDWVDANQRDLVGALERVRLVMTRYMEGSKASSEIAPAPAEASNAPFALAALVELFGLSDFERDVVLLCAGMEMDARFAPLVGAVLGDVSRRTPTFGLALAALPAAHWSALTPEAPLRAWRLIELSGAGLTTAGLKLDERVLNFLAGINQLDERLQGIAEVLPGHLTGRAIQDVLAGRVAAHLGSDSVSGAAHIVATDDDTRLAVATSACAALGAAVLRIRAAELPAGAADRFALTRLVARESLLGHAIPVVDVSIEVDGPRIAAFIELLPAPVIVCAAEPIQLLSGRAPVFEVIESTHEERLTLWREALGPEAARLNGALEGVCAQFDLAPASVRAVAARTRVRAAEAPPEDSSSLLWDACRIAARPRMEGLAQRVEAMASWQDLVLPAVPLQVLRTIAAHVRQRHRVYQQWGFAAKSARGLGISALFAGPSGTGKTMAAEVLAGDLRLDLYRIDLASVVSKYIGETEKNLKRLFDAAEGTGAILLFDEADALFGKRSEVKDSHDRYANIEVSYLLQRMETYRGLAILTSNMKQALDPAFLRRIRFVIQFPFPDAEHRAAIWSRIFPARTPTAALDYERLAQLSVTGGHIRNIALAAAFLAADRGQDVSMGHLAEAAGAEYAKLERSLSDGEIRGWDR
jgi:hypothetical protein